jgi:hypothetical protein
MFDSRLFVLVIAAVLFGCETTPRSYRNLGWAKVSAEQASAECFAYIAANENVTHFLCMRAKGWLEN